MDLHDGFVGVTREQLRVAAEADWAIEADEGVHFERAWLDPEAGKVFCLSTGPSKEAVLRIHKRAGHPSAEIYELPIEVSESVADGQARAARGAPRTVGQGDSLSVSR
jgi:hypothetical protein